MTTPSAMEAARALKVNTLKIERRESRWRCARLTIGEEIGPHESPQSQCTKLLLPSAPDLSRNEENDGGREEKKVENRPSESEFATARPRVDGHSVLGTISSCCAKFEANVRRPAPVEK